MNAIPPRFDALPGAHELHEPHEVAGLRWEALAEAARVVAALGGITPRPATPDAPGFAALVSQADPLRGERAAHGVADLVAVMEPGIAALLAVNARGADPRPAAQALWREFDCARAAVLAVLTPRVSV